MTTTTSPTTYHPVHEQHADAPTIPLGRVVRVELRKMFDTRSGFWLMASLVIVGVLATVGTILFAPDDQLTHNTFAAAIGFPMTIVLPIIAILAITGEWSQRTGLTTFTLVPNRRRVLLAKTVSSVVVGIAAMLVALVVGVVGNVVGTAITGTDLVWDLSAAQFGTIVIGSLLCLLTGTMLGMVIRNSAGGPRHVLRADAGPPDALRDPGRQPAGLRGRPPLGRRRARPLVPLRGTAAG